MPILELNDVEFSYGSAKVIGGVSLSISHESIVSVMGPSGCGKSTLLRLIAGLESPGMGQCRLDGKVIEGPAPLLRYSFQDYDAFPWKNVRDNLLLAGATSGLKSDRFDVDHLISRIGLNGQERKYPQELSGGMRKRLALGRCLASKPEVILLDEPFSSLDVDAKHEMYGLLQSLWEEWKCIVVIVTHDIHEAILLSATIYVSTSQPFRVASKVEVDRPFPRKESVADSSEYIASARLLRKLLQAQNNPDMD